MNEVINYIMETPGNTNPNVLKGMLENYVEPSGTIEITENGTVDVTKYSSAEVNVAGSGGNVWTGEITINNEAPSQAKFLYMDSSQDNIDPVYLASGESKTVNAPRYSSYGNRTIGFFRFENAYSTTLSAGTGTTISQNKSGGTILAYVQATVNNGNAIINVVST